MSTNVFFGGAGGQERTYYFNTVAVQEVVVDTGGNNAETETGGANVNIEATALEAGYGSKKNFYRAFRRVTGLTPAAFRRLSHERALHVVESLAAAPPRRAIAADRRR